MSKQKNLTHQEQIELTNQIVNHFTRFELKDLCFLVDIKFENLPGITINELARELVQHSIRHGKVEKLLAGLKKQRPKTNWDRPSTSQEENELAISDTNHVNQDAPEKKDVDLELPTNEDEQSTSTKQSSPTQISTKTERGALGNSKDSPSQDKAFVGRTPIWQIILTNFIFAGVGAYLFATYFKVLPFCTSTTISSFSISILIVLAVHAIWRILSPALNVAENSHTIKIATISLPLKPVQSALNAFHPWQLSNSNFGVSTIFLASSIWYLGLSSFSPLKTNTMLPRVAYYSITHEDNSLPQQLLPDQTLSLTAGQTTTIMVIGSDGLNCKWDVTHDNGVLLNQDGCTVTYVPAPDFKISFLEIVISTSCDSSINLYNSIQIVNASSRGI